MDWVKDAAYAAIAQAHYFGGCKKFSFEMYVTIHQDAYEDLEQYGQMISADKQVRDLLQGIKDPKLNAAKDSHKTSHNILTVAREYKSPKYKKCKQPSDGP
jgi:hypothetical protein